MGKKAAMGLMSTGIVLGIGSGMPGGAGVASMASFMPAAGTTAGAGIVVGMLGKLGKKK